MSKYFVVYTKDGQIYDFNQKCNRVLTEESNKYIYLIKEEEHTDILLAIIPHDEIKIIISKEFSKEERAVSMISGHMEINNQFKDTNVSKMCFLV